MNENELDMMQAYQKRMSMQDLLDERARIQAQLDSQPDVMYRNGMMDQNGQSATPEQIVAYDKTNPYVADNWLAKPEDRAVTSEQQSEEEARAAHAQSLMKARQDEMLSKQTDFFGGPIVRTDALPPKAVTVEKVSVSASPPKLWDKAVDPKPLLKSILGGRGGPLSGTATIRK